MSELELTPDEMRDGVTGALLAARALAENEDWDAAAQTLRPLAEVAPGAIELWLQIALWQQRDGHHDVASQTLRHALQLNAEREAQHVLPLWQALGDLHFETQDWAACIDACRAVLKIAPRAHWTWEMLAASLAHESRFDEAIEAVQRVLILSPRDPLHRMRLGSLLQAQGKSGEAVREFEIVLATAPDTSFAQDAEAAIEALDRAQIQQVLLRAGEQRAFGLHLERDLDGTLDDNAFYLSENGRETLRQMVWDGSDAPDTKRTYLH